MLGAISAVFLFCRLMVDQSQTLKNIYIQWFNYDVVCGLNAESWNQSGV